MAAATNKSMKEILSRPLWVFHPELLKTMLGLGLELIVVVGITGDAIVVDVMKGTTTGVVEIVTWAYDVVTGGGTEIVLVPVVTGGDGGGG
jgi:hypothetical protein